MGASSWSGSASVDVVANARSGSRDAWEALVSEHYPTLHRYLRSQLHDEDLASELVHDVLIEAGRLLPRLRDDRYFTPWLFRIAQNHLKRARRRRTVLGRFVSLDWLRETSAPVYYSVCQMDDFTGSLDEGNEVQECLLEITPPLRDALLLSAVGGLSAPEVAQCLGLSRVAAERRISRAKEQFRRRYNARADGGHK